jgi:hypothetical protein
MPRRSLKVPILGRCGKRCMGLSRRHWPSSLKDSSTDKWVVKFQTTRFSFHQPRCFGWIQIRLRQIKHTQRGKRVFDWD